MISVIWSRRAAALIVLACGVLSIGGLSKAVSAWSEVHAGEKDLTNLQAAPPAALKWVAPKPILRAGEGSTAKALEETLRRSLDVGPPALSIGMIRPLGGGLRLVDVAVDLPGDARVMESLAQWGAVNRDSVRVIDLRLLMGPDGQSRVTAKLLVVVA